MEKTMSCCGTICSDCQVHLISMVCSRGALQERIALYEKLETIKIDVSDISPEQAAELLAEMLTEGK